MSLSPYPHTVQVTTKKRTEDAAGAAEVTDDKTYSIRCRIRQISSDEIDANGNRSIRTIFKLYAASWPGGVKSTVTWNGRRLVQEGETHVRSSGYFPADDIVTLRALDTEFK